MYGKAAVMGLMVLAQAGMLLAQDGEGGGFRRGAGPGPRGDFRGERPAFAAGGPGEEGRMGDRPDPEDVVQRIVTNPKLAQELGLSDDQVKAVKDGLFELRQKQVELKAELELAGMEQAKLMTEKELDEKALMSAVEKTGKIRTEMAKLRVKGMLVLRQNIAPEQMERIQARVREHFHERMQRDRGGEGPGFRRGPGEGGDREGPARGRDGGDREGPGRIREGGDRPSPPAGGERGPLPPPPPAGGGRG